MSSPRAWIATTVSGIALLALSGCAGGGSPAPTTEVETAAPVEAPIEPAPVAPEPAAVPPVEEPAEEHEGAYGPKTVVIETPMETTEEEPTLVEAAALAKKKRAAEGAPIAVITDETLPEYATGELSIAMEKPNAKAKTGTATAAGTEEPAPEEVKGEAYWRERVRLARTEWRDLIDEIAHLEGEVGKLRTQFYAEDDGFYRDSQIKPAWDRALDRLAEARDQLLGARAGLEEILHEGRLAGALPGWLREGIEYEPEPSEPEDDLPTHESMEPQVVDEDDGDGRP